MQPLQMAFIRKTEAINVTEGRNRVILVKLFLLCGHFNTEDLLHLGRERFFHIFFDTPEQERLKDFVKTLIAVFPSLPMLILKILPGVKPTMHSRYRKCHSCHTGCHLPRFCSVECSKCESGRTCQAWGSVRVTRALWASSVAACR